MKRELTYSGMGPMEVLPVELGGTGQSSNPDTIRDFNMLTIPELNATNGVLGYRPDGTIDPSFIPNDVYSLIPIHLEFEAEYATNTQVNLLITDFDSWTTYQVLANFNGQSINATLNQETGVISLTTPSTVGQVLLTINGNTYYLNVVNMASVRVSKPSLLSPTNGSSNVNRTFQLLSSTMALSNGSATQHDRSDWQVASDSAFTQLVFQSINDTSHKTSIEASITQPNTQYFARVRHHDAVYGLSPWSNTISFTSKSTFAVSSETAKLLASDGVSGDYLGEAGYSYDARGTFETLAVNDTGSIVAASIRRIGSNGNSQGGLFVWKKQNGGWSEVKKILSSTSTQAQSMTLTIPSGGSLTVQIQGASPSTTTYTSSQVITIPAGTTSVILTGKGQNGTTNNTGLNTTATINGQTFTFAGGVGVNAVQSTQNYTVANYGYFARNLSVKTATKNMGGEALALNIPNGGSINVAFAGQSPSTSTYTNSQVLSVPVGTTQITLTGKGQDGTGLSSTATIADQTYTFSGGVGIPAQQSSSIIQSYENRMAVLNVTSMNNTQFTYDLIFYKEVGNDWTVAKTFSNIGVGKAAELTFKFSKDGNTFILSDVVNNRLLVYTYTSDWNTPTVINLNTYGITLSASLAVRYHITVNADGSRIGVVLLDSASVRHFVALSLTGGNWIKSYQYDFPTNDFVDCLYGNDDFSIFCGLCTTGSYPVVNVYTFNGAALTKVQAIEPPETDKAYSTFGTSMDISSNGNTIAISSLHFDANSQQSSTALIHIFERSTIWTLARSVSPSDIALEDRFGIEIDLSGDASTLISNGWSGTPRNNLGAIYVFN